MVSQSSTSIGTSADIPKVAITLVNADAAGVTEIHFHLTVLSVTYPCGHLSYLPA